MSKILVGYDGSVASRRALDFAIEAAKGRGASVVLVHVLEWSPFSFLTPNEIEERHKRRKLELERAESAILAPVREEYKNTGVVLETDVKYGHIADTISTLAKADDVEQVVIGRNGHSVTGARLFGSVAGSLAQSSPVSVTIVP
ncbi:MAG: universal stress protein [Pseudoruegeria sp.]